MRFNRFQLHAQRYSVSEVELTAWPPFVKIRFKREEFLDLPQVQDRIRTVLIHHFIRRQVMWLDLEKEGYDGTIGSLMDAGNQLDQEAAKLKAVGDPAHLGLHKLLTGWATACLMTRKNLVARWTEIAQEKAQVLGYDSAGEDRVDALHDALVGHLRWA